MNTELLNEILGEVTANASELPIWVVIVLGLIVALLTYAFSITIRNYLRLIVMPSTPTARLELGQKVELKGQIQPFTGETFTAPFAKIPVFYLSINCLIEEKVTTRNSDNKRVKRVNSQYYDNFSKGDDLFYLQDKSGKVLIAHYTFLNKNHKHKKFTFKPNKVPSDFMNLFPDLVNYRNSNPHKFVFECKYLETNTKALVTGKVVGASINGHSSKVIFGGMGEPTDLQKKILNRQEVRDFIADYKGIKLIDTKTDSDLSNTSNIEFGTEASIIARKTINLLFFGLLYAIFGGILWFIVQAKFF